MEENNNHNDNNNNNNKISIIIKRRSSSRKKRFIRWVLERGVGLGKNVIMTAVVVSSAPLLLPPLIAISAVGFLVWVPAGVVVAGYAAVEKLMTTLLPLPQAPSSTTHDDDDDDEQFLEEYGEYDKDGETVGIDENLEEESFCLGLEGECEKELKDAIDVYDDENLEKKGYEGYNGGKCIEGNEEGDTKEITTCVNSKEEYNVEEGECGDDGEGVNLEEDVDEHVEGEQETIPDDGDSIEEESYMDETESATAYESTLSAEEGNAGEQEDSRGSHTLECSSDIETEESADEPSTEVMAIMSEEKIWVDVDDDHYLERKHVVEGANVYENVEKKCYVDDGGKRFEGEHGDTEEIRTSVNLKEEYNVGDIGKNVAGERVDDKDVNWEDVDEEKQRLKEEEEEEGYMEEVDDHLDRDDDEEYLENVSTPLESGPKDASDGMDSECSSIYYTCTLSAVEGNEGEREDSLGLHASECSSDIKTKECADEPSTEVMGMMREEKIWEQVSAIRAILGYRDATQSSTVDEIKALFVFIGVEPPSPFDDPSDLTDVNEKLKILMSIVGTK